jgi:hypothetical protein
MSYQQAPASAGASMATHRCSGATVGDSPRGPLKQLGNPHLKPATSQSQTRLA